MHVDRLGLSQIYLSLDKIQSVTEWFDPQRMDLFAPLPVHNFGNNAYTLTDGHTRAYVAYKNGVSLLPVFYDKDDIVTNQLGQMLYKADIPSVDKATHGFAPQICDSAALLSLSVRPVRFVPVPCRITNLWCKTPPDPKYRLLVAGKATE